jgi:hypothetical protein
MKQQKKDPDAEPRKLLARLANWLVRMDAKRRREALIRMLPTAP